MTPEAKLVLLFGSKAKAAKALGKTYETIRLWCLNGIPLQAAFLVEKKTRGEVTAEEILRHKKAKKLAA